MHTKNDATTVETTHPYGARASRSRILIWVPKKHLRTYGIPIALFDLTFFSFLITLDAFRPIGLYYFSRARVHEAAVLLLRTLLLLCFGYFVIKGN